MSGRALPPSEKQWMSGRQTLALARLPGVALTAAWGQLGALSCLLPLIHTPPPPPRANPCLGLSTFLSVRLSQPRLDISLHPSHGCYSAPGRGRGQEDHSARGHRGAPQLHHWVSSEWGHPQTREGPSMAASAFPWATGHRRQVSALSKTARQMPPGTVNAEASGKL